MVCWCGSLSLVWFGVCVGGWVDGILEEAATHAGMTSKNAIFRHPQVSLCTAVTGLHHTWLVGRVEEEQNAPRQRAAPSQPARGGQGVCWPCGLGQVCRGRTRGVGYVYGRPQGRGEDGKQMGHHLIFSASPPYRVLHHADIMPHLIHTIQPPTHPTPATAETP